MYNIFDSHSHYDDKAFKSDLDSLLTGLQDKGVKYIMNAASDLSSAKRAQSIADKYGFLYTSVGVHPHEADKWDNKSAERLIELAAHPKNRAVGEIGLDYYYNFSDKKTQKAVFEKQLELSQQLNLPVIIHSREAWQDTLDILSRFKPRGVVHCFSGSAQTAEIIVKSGMYIGITGVVTFKNARKIKEAVSAIPLEYILIETDCPYMAPEPFRGKRSDSSMLKYVIEEIAKIKNISPQQVADITCKNAKSLFSIE